MLNCVSLTHLHSEFSWIKKFYRLDSFADQRGGCTDKTGVLHTCKGVLQTKQTFYILDRSSALDQTRVLHTRQEFYRLDKSFTDQTGVLQNSQEFYRLDRSFTDQTGVLQTRQEFYRLESSSTWNLQSCQPHRVISGRSSTDQTGLLKKYLEKSSADQTGVLQTEQLYILQRSCTDQKSLQIIRDRSPTDQTGVSRWHHPAFLNYSTWRRKKLGDDILPFLQARVVDPFML